MKKLVKESLNEDNIDKVRERRFGIMDKDEHDDFNKFYNAQKLAKSSNKDHNVIIEQNGNWILYKNPSSIKELGPRVRGIITENGDLYIENKSGGMIHVDLIKILMSKGILPNDTEKYGWGKRIPQESGFLTVQRYKDTQYIAIGESNKNIYEIKDWKEKVHFYDEFLKKAKQKNPNLIFTNKLVGIKVHRKSDEDEEGKDLNKMLESYNNQENLMINFINKQNGI